MSNLPAWWKHPKPWAIIDCLEGLRAIPDESVDMICTDPPYGIEFKSNHTDNHEKIKNDDLASWKEALPLWFAEFRRALTQRGVIAAFTQGGCKVSRPT